jgi:hypothetical protein
MRLVDDTNVFVSAALKTTSFPASVVRWADRYGGLLTSAATERQLLDVLQRPYIAGRMLASAELVAIEPGSPSAMTRRTTSFSSSPSTGGRI